jgi:hypothetical protein
MKNKKPRVEVFTEKNTGYLCPHGNTITPSKQISSDQAQTYPIILRKQTMIE